MAKKQLFDERESKTLELKSTLPKFETLIKTCIAFANGIGGSIIIGVEDNSLEICGIDEKIRKRVYDEFPNSLYDSTSPNLIAQIYEKNFNAHSVMIIKIPQSLKKPCFNRKEGIPKGFLMMKRLFTARLKYCPKSCLSQLLALRKQNDVLCPKKSLHPLLLIQKRFFQR